MTNPNDFKKPELENEGAVPAVLSEGERPEVVAKIDQIKEEGGQEVEKVLVAHKFDRLKFRRLYEVFAGRIDAQKAMDILGQLKVFVLVEDENMKTHLRILNSMKRNFMQEVEFKTAENIDEFAHLMANLANEESILLLDNNLNVKSTAEWLLNNSAVLDKANCYAFSFSGEGETAFQKLIDQGLMFPRWPMSMHKSLNTTEWTNLVVAYLAAKAYRGGLDDSDLG